MKTGLAMSGRDVALAVLTSMILGLVFVAIRIGLRTFPPFLWTAGCFVVGSLCLLPWRPTLDVSWRWVFLIGTALLVGRSGLLITGIGLGLPAGLASLILQMQVAFTAVFAAFVLGDIPSPSRICGIVISAVGVGLIGVEHRFHSGNLLAFLSVLAGAVAFAFGNVAIKLSGTRRPVALIAWAQLVVPVPFLALSAAYEGEAAFHHAWNTLSVPAFGAMVFTAAANLVGFSVWSRLLVVYGPSTVSPFALLVPFFGMTGTALAMGEPFTVMDGVVAALILGGLYLAIRAKQPALIVLPTGMLR